MLDDMRDLLHELDEVRLEAEQALKHLRDELDRVKIRNEDAVRELTANNNDLAARMRMEKTDETIETLKKQMAELRKDYHQKFHAKRLEIEKRCDAHIDEIQKELGDNRAEQEALTVNLIPCAQAKVDDLLERKQQLEERSRLLSQDLRQARSMDLTCYTLDIE